MTVTSNSRANVLLKQDRFTFGAWVESYHWDFPVAAQALSKTQFDGCMAGDLQLSLDQDEDGDSTVWDGAFEYCDGKMMYAGNDGPSGGSGKVVRRMVTADDVISVL